MNKKLFKPLDDLNRLSDLMRHNQDFLRAALDPFRGFRDNFNMHLSELSRKFEPYSSIKPAVEQSSSFLELNRHLKPMQELTTNLTKTDFLANLSVTSQIKAEIMQSQSFKHSLPSTFCMPNLVEITEISTAARKAFELPSLSSFLPNLNELTDAISSIKAALIDCTSVFSSFESVVGLASLGKAIRLAPYDPRSNDALRTLLGDWTGVGCLPNDIFSDWQARMKFYTHLGLDSRLTVLPEPAFTESLYTTAILRDDLFSPVFPDIELAEPEEDADNQFWDKQRMIRAYDILFSFETHMRAWLDDVMTGKFGMQWEKQRVPGDVHKAWKEKRQEAVGRGERKQRLVWYADFTDYIKIITRNDNWNEVFAAVFRNLMDIQVSFWRLHPIRICTMHSRILTKEDLLLLVVEVQRILRAIGRLSDNDIPNEWDDTDLM